MTEIIGIVKALLGLSPSELLALGASLVALYHFIKGRSLASQLEKTRTELFKAGVDKSQAETDALLNKQTLDVQEATRAYEKALENLNRS